MSNQQDEFVRYCCELLSGLGPCTGKRMFGGFAISTGGLTFALVADLGGGAKLWLKATDEAKAAFEAAGCERFSYEMIRNGVTKANSMNYYSAPDEAMESRAVMQPWGRLALDCALKARATRKPRAKAAIKKRATTIPAKVQTANPPTRLRTSRPIAAATRTKAARKSSKG